MPQQLVEKKNNWIITNNIKQSSHNIAHKTQKYANDKQYCSTSVSCHFVKQFYELEYEH